MLNQREIRRFGLYGEGRGPIEPEFVHIENISTRSRLHNWNISPHIHPGIFQLLFLHEGRGVVAFDGAELPLEPAALVIVPCGCVHAFRFAPQTEGWVLSIADSLVNDGRLAEIDLSSTVQGSEVMRLPLETGSGQVAFLGALLGELASRQRTAPGHLSNAVVSIVGLVLSLVEELAREAQPADRGIFDRHVSLVRRFNKLVEKNLREQWSIGRYAKELGTSAPTLTRACREVSGMAPAQLVLDRRLREAKRALSYTDAGIGMISDDLGFSDPAYFARVFKQHTGKTASAFRKERFWPAAAARRPVATAGGSGDAA